MKVVIYSKDNCPNCVKAKALMEQHNPEIVKLGEDISRDAFFEKFPGVKTVPQIEIDDQYIGGYTDLEKWLSFNTEEDF